MILDFTQNGLSVIFEITDGKRVFLKDFSLEGTAFRKEKKVKWCPALELHVSGENQDDHHGAKHTGTSGFYSLLYDGHRYYENDHGNKLEITLCDNKLNAVLHYQFYRNLSAVRTWTTVYNRSHAAVGLEYISSFAYTGLSEDHPGVLIPHNSWRREANWKDYSLEDLGLDRDDYLSMKRISVSNTGMWSCKEYLPMAAYYDEKSTLMWQIESNGSWHWEISDIFDMLYLRLSGPTEQENHWYKELLPGESFESVKACLTVGSDFNAALEAMTRYRRRIAARNAQDQSLPVIFNDGMCLDLNPTAAKSLPVIDRAAEVGAECYLMDAGWYSPIGTTWWETVGQWLPDEKRFPGGIKKVFDYIKSKGMIPGIWLELEVMGIGCPLADRFEDECFFMRHGKRVIDHGRYQLDFRHPKVRRFVTSVVDRVVQEYGIGYIKTDYNIEGGIGTEVDSDSFGDGLLMHNRAYLDWVDEIRAKYPDLIIEGCSSGGMRMDYAHLQHHHLLSVSDQPDRKYTAYVASAVPTAVLPEQSLVWSYPRRTESEHEAAFNMVNSMLQRMNLSGDILDWDAAQFSLVKAGVDCYKAIRNKIPESVPIFPLGIPKRGDSWLCLALKGKSNTKIAVWRMDSQDESILIPLRAEKAEKLYPALDGYTVSLCAGGVRVTLPEKHCAVLLEIM